MAFGSNPSPGVGDMVCIAIPFYATADVTSGPVCKVPFACRVRHIAGCGVELGGTTPFTDAVLTLKNNTKSETIGTATLVASSAFVASTDAPASAGVADLAAGDQLEVESDITGGGGSPTLRGVLHVYVTRE